MILSAGCYQVPMAGHCILDLQGYHSLAKLLEPPLRCTLVSSSWAKGIVDVVSCLLCFTTHFELKQESYSNLLFV